MRHLGLRSLRSLDEPAQAPVHFHEFFWRQGEATCHGVLPQRDRVDATVRLTLPDGTVRSANVRLGPARGCSRGECQSTGRVPGAAQEGAPRGFEVFPRAQASIDLLPQGSRREGTPPPPDHGTAIVIPPGARAVDVSIPISESALPARRHRRARGAGLLAPAGRDLFRAAAWPRAAHRGDVPRDSAGGAPRRGGSRAGLRPWELPVRARAGTSSAQGSPPVAATSLTGQLQARLGGTGELRGTF